MGGLVKPLMIVAAIAVNVIPGVGQVLSAAMISSITMMGVTAAIGMAAQMLGPKPKGPTSNQEARGMASADVTTPRKIVFGSTAAAPDIRFEDYTTDGAGDDKDRFHRVLVLAGHPLTDIKEIWFEKDKAWAGSGDVTNSTAGVTAKFKNGSTDGSFLWVTTRKEGTAANTITIPRSTKWGANNRFTRCAYLYLEAKLTYNEDDNSPFAQMSPNEIIVRCDGAAVYDPRKDSTRGGSGTQRYDDEDTWKFDDGGNDQGNNPALQLLTYLIGWRSPITGWLHLGLGIPIDRIDVASFIAAANACDEPVALAAGGTEKRYRSACVFTDADDPTSVFNTLCNAMNGMFRDAGGKLSLTVIVNDLATPAADFTDDDILGSFEWAQTPALADTFNDVRGRYTDPSDKGLFKLMPYEPVTIAPLDEIERSINLDLPAVQSHSQAQRLAKQMLQRSLSRGKFRCEFSHRGYLIQLGDVVRLTFTPLGWVNKLFRVVEHSIRQDGIVPVVLQEENSAIYAWDAEEAPPITYVEPTVYDPLQNPLLFSLNLAYAKLLTVDTGATSSDNLIRNGWLQDGTNFLTLSECTRELLPAGSPAPNPVAPSYGAVAPPQVPNLFMYPANALTEVQGDAPYYVGAFFKAEKSDDLNVCALVVSVWWYDAASAYIGGSVGQTVIVPAGSNFGWGYIEASVTRPPGAVYATPHVAADHDSHTVSITGFRLSRNQSGAERFAQITGPSTLNVAADHTGTLTGSSPYASGSFKLMENGQPVTSGITWSRSTPDGITTSITGTGTATFSVTGMTALTREVLLTASRPGLPDKTFPVVVNRIDAPPPSGGGGGGGGSVDSQTSGFAAITGASAIVVSNELEVTIGAGGSATFSTSLALRITPINGNAVPNVRFQWERWNGSAWVSQGSTFDSDPDAREFFDAETSSYYTEDGAASSSQNYSGTGTLKMRLTAWLTTNTTRTVNVQSGNVTLNGGS